MDNSAIEVFPETHIESPFAHGDCVLQVQRELLNIRATAEGKQCGLRARASVLRLRCRRKHRSREVKAPKRWDKGRNRSPRICAIVWLKRARAVAKKRWRGASEWARIGRIQADRIEGRIRNSEVEILRQERMLKRDAGFDVVFALHVRHVRTQARVGQFPLLIQRR